MIKYLDLKRINDQHDAELREAISQLLVCLRGIMLLLSAAVIVLAAVMGSMH